MLRCSNRLVYPHQPCSGPALVLSLPALPCPALPCPALPTGTHSNSLEEHSLLLFSSRLPLAPALDRLSLLRPGHSRRIKSTRGWLPACRHAAALPLAAMEEHICQASPCKMCQISPHTFFRSHLQLSLSFSLYLNFPSFLSFFPSFTSPSLFVLLSLVTRSSLLRFHVSFPLLPLVC